MFLGRVTNWTSVVGQNIPFITIKNSNNKIANNSGAIQLLRKGWWDLDASLVLTGVADDVIVSVYADNAEDGTYAEASVTAAGFTTVSLTDAIHTILTRYPDVATIGIRVDTAGVDVSGQVRIAYVS